MQYEANSGHKSGKKGSGQQSADRQDSGAQSISEEHAVVDKFNRPLRDLRVSVTDRCNFRCVYCMPKSVFNKDYKFLPRAELLSFEEITRVVRAAAQFGVSKIRLTGGEPLVRNDLEKLVSSIANVEGITDISLTTNASLLTKKRADSLRNAGLKRLNISLDAIDDETFKRVNDVDIGVKSVLDGIENASVAGFDSIKVNMVVKKGLNDHSIDVGSTNAWDLSHVVTSAQIADRINASMPIQPIEANYRGEVAKRWQYVDGGGEIGIITSVSDPFCGDCSRARLSATGSIYTCLFATSGHDLRSVLRSENDEALASELHRLWSVREDRYSETRTQVSVIRPKVEMSFIGG